MKEKDKVPCTFVNILASRTTAPTVRYCQAIYKMGQTTKINDYPVAERANLIYYQHNCPYYTSLSFNGFYVNKHDIQISGVRDY